MDNLYPITLAFQDPLQKMVDLALSQVKSLVLTCLFGKGKGIAAPPVGSLVRWKATDLVFWIQTILSHLDLPSRAELLGVRAGKMQVSLI